MWRIYKPTSSHNAAPSKLPHRYVKIWVSIFLYPYICIIKSVFIFADKTRHIYETDKTAYKKLLTDNISKTYKKTEHDIYNKINKEAKTIANNYGVSERVDCLAKSNAFVSLKDHKSNFSSNPKCRLINPAKSEMGKISKYFLE